MYIDPNSELGRIRAKTGYVFNYPREHKSSTVFYLEVIKPLKWFAHYAEIDPYLIPVGSLTWAYHYNEKVSVLIEDNRFYLNIDPTCFRLVSVGTIEKVEKKEETLAYRVKTKEEFIQDGKWIHRGHTCIDKGHPESWLSSGKMNKYLGQLATDEQNIEIELAKKSDLNLIFEGLTFSHSDFIEAFVIHPEKKIVTHQKDDLKDLVEQHHPIPTFRHPDYISYGVTKENLTDDIVIESTINITI
jgi:hypothetical protein